MTGDLGVVPESSSPRTWRLSYRDGYVEHVFGSYEDIAHQARTVHPVHGDLLFVSVDTGQ